MNRVLLTGEAGFIGMHVAEALLREGYEVVGADILDDAYDRRLKEWRLGRLINQDVDCRKVDISVQQDVEALFRTLQDGRSPVSAVVNLAARAGVRRSVRDPWVYYQANVVGTLNLLEACRRFGIQKFVLASTSSVYGDGRGPFVESLDTSRPISPYAASKKAAEVLCHVYHCLYGLDVTILRYFTVYGPAGRPDMGYFRFIRWIVEGEPVLLYGDGTQRRDFTYVGDIASGTVRALRPLGYEIINLGGDQPIELREMVWLLEDVIGQKARLSQSPARPEDVHATWAGIAKASKLLNWKPQTSLRDGLAAAAAWYQENRDLARSLDLGEL